MIGEGGVLLGIEDFEQRCRWVAAEIGRELVDLIEQDDRIDSAGLFHGVDDAARHGADIGPPVATDLRLVPYTTEADANEFPSHRGGNRAAEEQYGTLNQ